MAEASRPLTVVTGASSAIGYDLARICAEHGFFERAGMLDTKVGQGKNDDSADMAQASFDAMMCGDSDVVRGWQNKLQAASLISRLAEQHRKMAEEPGGANH